MIGGGNNGAAISEIWLQFRYDGRIQIAHWINNVFLRLSVGCDIFEYFPALIMMKTCRTIMKYQTLVISTCQRSVWIVFRAQRFWPVIFYFETKDIFLRGMGGRGWVLCTGWVGSLTDVVGPRKRYLFVTKHYSEIICCWLRLNSFFRAQKICK